MCVVNADVGDGRDERNTDRPRGVPPVGDGALTQGCPLPGRGGLQHVGRTTNHGVAARQDNLQVGPHCHSALFDVYSSAQFIAEPFDEDNFRPSLIRSNVHSYR